jgi:hypothetical protein
VSRASPALRFDSFAIEYEHDYEHGHDDWRHTTSGTVNGAL